jgi:hypothetical protein
VEKNLTQMYLCNLNEKEENRAPKIAVRVKADPF